MVVIGNPPYSAGQENQNDDNQNVKYETLDARIATTYAALSTATNKNSLYDSYIRAIRWASDRIRDEGVVAFVSNGGYIDGSTADGLRKSMVQEFEAIYCYNLRGNQRTAGEQSRKEGGKVFGSGSRNTVAILILVKGAKGSESEGTLHYWDIGDYLSREDKLRILAAQDLEAVPWEEIVPSSDGDWINQRDERFSKFQSIGDKEKKVAIQPIFEVFSRGLETGRDAWVYRFSFGQLTRDVQASIEFYNEQVSAFAKHRKAAAITNPTDRDVDAFIDRDSTRISWNRVDKNRLAKGKLYAFAEVGLRRAAYRPFCRQWVYFDSQMNSYLNQLPRISPTSEHGNIGFYITGLGALKPFSI